MENWTAKLGKLEAKISLISGKVDWLYDKMHYIDLFRNGSQFSDPEIKQKFGKVEANM